MAFEVFQRTDAGGRPIRATMTMRDAAAAVGVSMDTVRRWIDAHEPTEQEPNRVPVAARERDEQGRARSGAWRRPYTDAVEEWARRRAGQAG